MEELVAGGFCDGMGGSVEGGWVVGRREGPIAAHYLCLVTRYVGSDAAVTFGALRGWSGGGWGGVVEGRCHRTYVRACVEGRLGKGMGMRMDVGGRVCWGGDRALGM